MRGRRKSRERRRKNRKKKKKGQSETRPPVAGEEESVGEPTKPSSDSSLEHKDGSVAEMTEEGGQDEEEEVEEMGEEEEEVMEEMGEEEEEEQEGEDMGPQETITSGFSSLAGQTLNLSTLLPPALTSPPPRLAKYWSQRYRIFSQYDQGVRMDEGEPSPVVCGSVTVSLCVPRGMVQCHSREDSWPHCRAMSV